jgi:branched-chain amino acid transport system ATP-binding protein
VTTTGGLFIRDLEAGYDGSTVLKGLSFSVAVGSTLAFVGPNGHGKTTILRSIFGLVSVTSGSIRLANEDLLVLRPDQVVERGIVHIPQGDMIFPAMTVSDNLLVGAHPKRAYRSRAASLDEVFDLLPKLYERRGQIASTLSGGERRMLAIGRGLMARGAFLLIDEPSLGLAPIVIEQIYLILRRLKAEGRTIILVEETPSRVVDVADQVHLIDDGKIVWTGDGSDVATSSDFLASYLGG